MGFGPSFGIDNRIKTQVPVWKLIMMVYFSTCYAVFILITIQAGIVASEAAQLINFCIGAKFTKKIDAMVFLLADSIFSGCFLTPIGYIVLSVVYPCMPPLLTSLTQESCRGTGKQVHIGILGKILVGMMEGYTWTIIWSMTSVIIFMLLIHPGRVQITVLDKIKGKIEAGFLTSISEYRQLQIVSTLQNEIFKSPAMPVYLGGSITAEVASIYALIRSSHELPAPVFGLFCTVATTFSIFIQVGLKVVAYPNLRSNKLRDTWKSQMNKWLKMYLRSIKPLKLSMGDGTFFDQLTSLKIWQFAIQQLITLMLI
ncbi:uncharacterized protein LOC118436527 [Folsomia candida]|nr:uncharacterized protein LOC118436527 [Folsomia candida]